jgi:hypothetical protein
MFPALKQSTFERDKDPAARATVTTEKGVNVFDSKAISNNPVILAFRPSGRKAHQFASASTATRSSSTRRQTSPRRPDGERIAASDCRARRWR